MKRYEQPDEEDWAWSSDEVWRAARAAVWWDGFAAGFSLTVTALLVAATVLLVTGVIP